MKVGSFDHDMIIDLDKCLSEYLPMYWLGEKFNQINALVSKM